MLDGHRLHLSQAADLQPADKKGNEQWAVEDSVQSFYTPKEQFKENVPSWDSTIILTNKKTAH